MQEVSGNMLAVLKSKTMIGDNRPTAEVMVAGGGEGAVRNFSDNLVWVQQGYSGSPKGTSNWVKTNDGRYMCCGFDPTTKELQTYYSSDLDFLSVNYAIETYVSDSSITVEKVALNQTSLYKREDGKVLLFVTSSSSVSWAKCYISNSGNGNDWVFLSTILSDRTGSDESRVNMNMPIKTSTGRLILTYLTGWNRYSGYLFDGAFTAYSDDGGATWVNQPKNRTAAYGVEFVYQPVILSDGTIIYCEEVGSLDSNIYKSTDSGGTWSYVGQMEWAYGIALYMDRGTLYSITSSVTKGINVYIGPELTNSNLSEMMLQANWEHKFTGTANGYTESKIYELDGYLVFQNYHYNSILGLPPLDTKINPKSIQISRAKGMAGGLTVELDNKDGILAPDGTVNPQLLWPNKEIVVKQGYGSELLTTFTGLIDYISMKNSGEDGASISISARDMMKPLIDHYLRNSEFLYTLTYTNMTVEHIWENLMILAGVEYDKIEQTGLTISEKTFSWESYADAVSWCDEIAGFQTYCDELGKMNFVKDGRPEGAATAYIFREGEDLIEIGYDINDEVLYYAAVCYGKTPEIRDEETNAIIQQSNVLYFAKQLPQAEYWNVPSGKILKIDAPDADTIEKCEIIVNKAIYLMQTKARQVQFKTIGIPHLQIGDFIQVIESSTTISEIYRITDISSSQSESEYTMTLTCYYHGAEV